MRRLFTKLSTIALMMGAMGLMGSSSNTNSNAPTQTKDAVSMRDRRSTVQKEIPRGFSYDNRPGNAAGRFLNQRQYRKKCRSNPSLYKSSKHRSKN